MEMTIKNGDNKIRNTSAAIKSKMGFINFLYIYLRLPNYLPESRKSVCLLTNTYISVLFISLRPMAAWKAGVWVDDFRASRCRI